MSVLEKRRSLSASVHIVVIWGWYRFSELSEHSLPYVSKRVLVCFRMCIFWNQIKRSRLFLKGEIAQALLFILLSFKDDSASVRKVNTLYLIRIEVFVFALLRASFKTGWKHRVSSWKEPQPKRFCSYCCCLRMISLLWVKWTHFTLWSRSIFVCISTCIFKDRMKTSCQF